LQKSMCALALISMLLSMSLSAFGRTAVGLVSKPDSLCLVLSVLALFFVIFGLAKHKGHDELQEFSKNPRLN
jgi:uncharacterized Tic20 family protein